MTTVREIRTWLEAGKAAGATHVIVVCDTFDYGDYPVYVRPDQDVREVVARYRKAEMQRVMECYCLNRDFDAQLSEHRAFHYE